MSLNLEFADISSNNSEYNAGSYASAGHPVAMIKATEGDHYINPDYAAWVRDSRRHKLPVFHYHFARPENGDPIGQMRHFWEVVRGFWHRPINAPHLPGDTLVIDLETGSPTDARLWIREAELELMGLANYNGIVCYTYLSYFNSGRIAMRSKRIHIAAYGNSAPFRRFGPGSWQLNGQNIFAWQHTDGRVGAEPHGAAGIGICDMSTLNPTVAKAINKYRARF